MAAQRMMHNSPLPHLWYRPTKKHRPTKKRPNNNLTTHDTLPNIGLNLFDTEFWPFSTKPCDEEDILLVSCNGIASHLCCCVKTNIESLTTTVNNHHQLLFCPPNHKLRVSIMKVNVLIKCGNEERSLLISCGRGDKTFKWLGMVASQRHAQSIPNGTLRRRDTDMMRASSCHDQQAPENMILPGGEYAHPSAQIADYIEDGDTVICVLSNSLSVSKLSTPTGTKWSTLAFTTSTDHEHSFEEKEEEGPPLEALRTLKTNASFMKVILQSQMMDEKQLTASLNKHWESVSKVMPRISLKVSEELKDICGEYIAMLESLFKHYASSGDMDLETFRNVIEESETFYQKDTEKLSTRVFNNVLKATSENSLHFGSFLAALVLCAQTRHNDTLDQNTSLKDPKGAFHPLLSQNMFFLTNKLNLACLVRAELCSEENLSFMRQYHADLFLTFEGYANSLLREFPLTITAEQMAEILFDAGLIESASNVKIADNILRATREGMIRGRAVFLDPDDPDSASRFPEDEFTFPEFCEGVQRAGIIYYANGENFPSSDHEGDEESSHQEPLSMIESMLQGLEDVVASRTKKTAVINNKNSHKYKK